MHIHYAADKKTILGGISSAEIISKECFYFEKYLMQHKYRYYIGIDPDIDKSGLAIWDRQKMSLLKCDSWRFFEIFDFFYLTPIMKEGTIQACLQPTLAMREEMQVNIEGAWLESKSNWHKQNTSKAVGEQIAKNVGRNHQVGLLFVEMCIHLDISFIVRKVKSPIFNNEDYFKRVTGWKHKTNKDARSAANYVFSL